jgi:CheY-like chemotaxis protein
MRDMMKPAILIIENDEDTRRLYADLLTYTDAKIVEAGNPYEAFEQLRRNPISLIVTDLHMPGGGVDYLTHLRQKEPTCPIIAITARRPSPPVPPSFWKNRSKLNSFAKSSNGFYRGRHTPPRLHLFEDLSPQHRAEPGQGSML